MKTRYLALVTIVSLAFLSGCEKNRFTEYEPYSSFDDRMAEAGRPPTPYDPMTPMDNDSRYSSTADSYGSYSSSSDYSSVDSSSNSSSGPKRSMSMSSGQSDLEVPYSDTRKKQAYNVGGLSN